MSDWDASQHEPEIENVISLEELEYLENSNDKQEEHVDEDDWGDSYNDLDSEAWERHYGQDDEEEITKDPWDLE